LVNEQRAGKCRQEKPGEGKVRTSRRISAGGSRYAHASLAPQVWSEMTFLLIQGEADLRAEPDVAGLTKQGKGSESQSGLEGKRDLF
jgi:hypothetical protein